MGEECILEDCSASCMANQCVCSYKHLVVWSSQLFNYLSRLKKENDILNFNDEDTNKSTSGQMGTLLVQCREVLPLEPREKVRRALQNIFLEGLRLADFKGNFLSK